MLVRSTGPSVLSCLPAGAKNYEGVALRSGRCVYHAGGAWAGGYAVLEKRPEPRDLSTGGDDDHLGEERAQGFTVLTSGGAASVDMIRRTSPVSAIDLPDTALLRVSRV